MVLSRAFVCAVQVGFFNPNPHSLKTITKLTASGWKEPLLPHPLNSTVAGKICLIKTQVILKLSSKAHWNLRFYVKPLKQISLLRYLARHFLFLKNNLSTASSTFYRSKKKGSFNSIAVRIRVKLDIRQRSALACHYLSHKYAKNDHNDMSTQSHIPTVCYWVVPHEPQWQARIKSPTSTTERKMAPTSLIASTTSHVISKWVTKLFLSAFCH
jgi:hypothetical protein